MARRQAPPRHPPAAAFRTEDPAVVVAQPAQLAESRQVARRSGELGDGESARRPLAEPREALGAGGGGPAVDPVVQLDEHDRLPERREKRLVEQIELAALDVHHDDAVRQRMRDRMPEARLRRALDAHALRKTVVLARHSQDFARGRRALIAVGIVEQVIDEGAEPVIAVGRTEIDKHAAGARQRLQRLQELLLIQSKQHAADVAASAPARLLGQLQTTEWAVTNLVVELHGEQLAQLNPPAQNMVRPMLAPHHARGSPQRLEKRPHRLPQPLDARVARSGVFLWVLSFGRRDWTRTNDPYHVKVVL